MVSEYNKIKISRIHRKLKQQIKPENLSFSHIENGEHVISYFQAR